MAEDFLDKQRQQDAKMRSIMDYTRGVFFFFLGLFFILYRQFGIRIMDHEPSSIDYFIGGLFVIYGTWRFYRGYQKNYYK